MILPGRGRRFVPGVAAGICRRPIDRPSAETHPPNNSMNVYLVNFPQFSELRKSWRLLFCCHSRRPSVRS